MTDVSHKNEETHERKQQGVIDILEQEFLACDNYDKYDDRPRYDIKDCRKRKKKQKRIAKKRRFVDRLDFLHLQAEGLRVFGNANQQNDCQDPAGYDIRQHGNEKLDKAEVVIRIDEKVLGIADRGKGAADIGCNRLEDNGEENRFCLLAQRKNDNGQRNKGDECDIVGYEHGGKEGDTHQNQADLTRIMCKSQEDRRKLGKQVHFPKTCNNNH